MPNKPTGPDDLDAKPVRRTFTPEFKARILAEHDAAPDAPTISGDRPPTAIVTTATALPPTQPTHKDMSQLT